MFCDLIADMESLAPNYNDDNQPSEIDSPQIEPTKPITKADLLALCRVNGVSIPDASKVLGYNQNYAYATAKKLSSRWDVASPKRVKVALKSLDLLIQGKTVGNVETIKDSTVLGATKEVLDRYQPIKRTDAAPQSITFIQVNVGEYK